MSLPTYPFARERYWVDTAGGGPVAGNGAAAGAILHPLLHSNTSDLGEQRYSSWVRKEIVFNAYPQVAGTQEQRKKPTGISLAAPPTLIAVAVSFEDSVRQPPSARASVTLSTATLGLPVPSMTRAGVSSVLLFDSVNGTLSIHITPSVSRPTTPKYVIAQSVLALVRIQQIAST